MLETVRAQDQHGHDDADQASENERNGVDPDRRFVGVLVGEVRDDETAEGAQEGAQEVGLGVALAGEAVGVVRQGQHLEDLVELGGAEEEARVVHEAEHEHGHAAHGHAQAGGV